jgi:hypothetical protein
VFHRSPKSARSLPLPWLVVAGILAGGAILACALPIDPPVSPADSSPAEGDAAEPAVQPAPDSGDSGVETALVGGQCNCGMTWFHSTYGDNTQVYVPTPGDVDLFSSYPIPSFVGNQSRWQNTDDPNAPVNEDWPFFLDGYCPFDPTTVQCATLRFDVYYDENRDVYWNDTVGFYNNAGIGVAGYAYATDLQTRLRAVSNNQPQWVAVCMDLVSGRVYASQIDAFGVPIRCYDQIGAVSATVRSAILNAAADGDLSGHFQDDLPISFVSLSGFAQKATVQRVVCPTSVNIIRGGYQGGSASSLCVSDDQYYEVESYNQTWTHRVVEWEAVFNVADPNDPNNLKVCEMAIEAEGKRTNKPDVIQVSLKDHTTGQFIFLGNIAFGEKNDLSGTLTACGISKFVDPNGQVTVRVFTERHYPQNFTLKTDVLRIWARYSQ